MFAIIIVLNFIVCFLFSLALLQRVLPERPTPYVALCEAFTIACLCFSVETWFFIEGLSLFNALGTSGPLASCYFLSFLVLLAGQWNLRKFPLQTTIDWRKIPQEPFLRKLVVLIAILIFLPLFFVAIYYPSCTADSMSYHLPRILHWIQNGNVEMYPTNYPRQLYHQPFAEYLFFGWELFCGGDYFDNTVQLISLVGVLCLMCLLVHHFGGGGRCQMLACLIVLSSPITIFEAPTTQTDIILTFFFFSFLYFGLKLSQSTGQPPKSMLFLEKERIFYAIGMGISLGLSLNTKFSIAPFEIPFCIWFGLRYLKLYGKKVVPIFALLVVGFLIFNGPFFLRNIRTCGNMFGLVEHQKTVRNARFGPDVVFSNAIRNIGMQLRIPNEEINRHNKWFLIKLHHFFGMTWADYQTSFSGAGTVPYEYETVFVLDDYRSGNMLIILLFSIVSLSGVAHWGRKMFLPAQQQPEEFGKVQKLRKRSTEPSKQQNLLTKISKDEQLPLLKGIDNSRELTIYVWLTVFGFLLFSALFRWQPFGTRLLLPNFLGYIPFIALELYRLLPKKRIVQFIPLLFGISFLYVLFLTSNSMFFNPLDAMTSFKEKPISETTEDDKTEKSENSSDVLPRKEQEVRLEISLTNPELLEEYFTMRPWRESYLFRRKYGYFRAVHLYMVDYLSITNKINELGYTKIGLALDTIYDRWEYPFWPLLRSFGRNYQIEWVVYPELLKNTPNYNPNFVPELIITDFSPDVIAKYFEIEHAWKYEYLVLLQVKKKIASSSEPNGVSSR